MRLADKVALVTGSSRGIGREIAIAMAREGADILVNYSRNKDAAFDTAEKIKALGRRAIVVQADVSERSQVERLFGTAVEEFGRLDVLVNNAGGFPIKPFAAVTDEEWDKVMDLDLKSIFMCSQTALASMRRQRGGTIINMASVSGLVGAVGMVPYSAAKGGVIAFSKALARELAPLGITVNAIAPGIIETDTALDIFPEGALKVYTTYQVPLGRLGRPEEVVGLAVFLASDEARYITGQVYAVDGGFTMQ
ncbi:MAG: 3-oxoacyl-ACP reductase FabG [Proteobacteria bacterium]|nr:3-oxoacyl-ACP reductase FabG [Pseudomonadota bacterium]MBU1743915.1 3-oxoacyl-ACP reductase FabG [Pseudomonadota bacterium]MBU1964490.1 3-oxoacyl-ACP reductase FabG [Pseudomonadota bacterium]MBU4583454.1 3-oxoacyl-ACP reductase FabG [Pseudomonadota bacterium]